jgi:hypothetical protein
MTKPLYFYNGTTFEEIGPTTPQSPIAYQTSAPTGPATGDLWIDSDGDVDTYNRQLTRYYFVATAAQTTITGTDANGLTLAYVAGSEAVYVNGALQVRGQDYTATNGTSVTGLTALAVNDVVEIFAYTAFTVANAYTKSETDGIAAAAAGLRMVVPTSVAVGSGTGSVDADGKVTFTTVSSISLNGCFSSTYKNYKIIFAKTSSSGSPAITLRLRASGTDNSSSNYSYNSLLWSNGAQTGYDYARANTSAPALTSSILGYAASTGESYQEYELFNPFETARTGLNYKMTMWNGSDFLGLHGSGIMSVTTSYDGVTFTSSTGTITGTVSVYGYKD